MGIFSFARKWEECKKDCGSVGGGGGKINRWSDCGCETCISWMKEGRDKKLYVAVREPSRVINDDCGGDASENVIFLHGFLSSSSFWTETVFPNLSESVKHNYRLFAVDLLGFGRSPKPRDCLYTLRDHLEMIEKSVINSFQLKSFHLVAHSMGCIIATALAVKYSKQVKSITLVAPGMGKDSEAANLEKGSRFQDHGPDKAHPSFSLAYHAQCDMVKICVIQGDCDQVVPVECSYNIKKKVPDAEVNMISNADHTSVVIGREKDFTQNLEHIWASFATEFCLEDDAR
ncbi:unnamed protein product [Dovyalis caffra]|uniref:AB hydrolase-1 domain-containing protein n=1 Tax=Dovyalis caffra TaxID=77055 RepID=A0AAV1RX47_9ROSI|nr:unnamed protein product [Dovyalis caffra]